ncbi:MAG: DUF2061 domain-containing protein [Candidatus Levybacteria bacterium]|nr:DUF2061 domain-containing protein [Candidatus Levybacteria bacterium]
MKRKITSKDSHLRSIVKAVGYRLLLIISSGIVIYLVTKRIDITLGVSLLTAVLNTIIYYFYERFWNKITWGK